MKIWFKIWKEARMVKTETVDETKEETRTHRVFAALEEACLRFDLGKPIWLDSNIQEFKRRACTRFTQDNFIEEIEFDYMEMQVLEES